MADHTGRVIVLTIDRLRKGVITRAEAAAELLTHGVGIDRTHAALLGYDRSRTPATSARVIAAADALTAACESATSTEQQRADAHYELFTAVRDYRDARDNVANPPTARDVWRSAFPTAAALEAAFGIYRSRTTDTPTIG